MEGPMLRLLLAICLLFGGCSIEGAIDSMASDEEKRFAQQTVNDIRTRNLARLRESFDPSIWDESLPLLVRAATAYPRGAVTTRLVSYHRNTQWNVGAATERRVQYLLVSEGEGRWAVTTVETYALGEARPRIRAWHVRPSAERPPELVMVDASRRLVPFLWAFAIGFLLVLVGILAAYVRYRRRKREQLSR